MKNKINFCPVCGNKKNSNLFKFKQFPNFTIPLNVKDIKFIKSSSSLKYPYDDLSASNCNVCHHGFLSTIPNFKILDKLYSDYYNYPSPLKGTFVPVRDNNFIKVFIRNAEIKNLKKEKSKAFEIGCFDGYVLKKLQDRGFGVTGCDPSKGAKIGQKAGIKIIREFFDPNKKNYGKFDYVIARHLIEHVINPVKWLSDLKKVTKKNGKIFIETPNINFFTKRGMPSVFTLQHLHYFSKNSLSYLIEKVGLEVKKCEEIDDNLILIAEFKSKNRKKYKKDKKESFSKFKINLFQSRKFVKKTLKKFDSLKGNVAVWGAGGFGGSCHLFWDFSVKKINFFIDSDRNKHGMKFSDSNASIISPQSAKEKKIKLILVASMYSEKIIKSIYHQGFSCRILSLYPKVILKTRRT